MNLHDEEYHKLLRLVIEQGKRKKNRTGVDTFGVFGAQARFDLSKGFPLLTTKKVFFKGIAHELLWFLSGSTNIKYLVDNNVHIWDGNAYDKYKKTSARYRLGADQDKQTKEWFLEQVKNRPDSTHEFGELGEGTYGGMWRRFPAGKLDSKFIDSGGPMDVSLDDGESVTVDQIEKVIKALRENPDDRRMIVSAWHPYWVDHCALPPCHVLFHFNTEELSMRERVKLYDERNAAKISNQIDKRDHCNHQVEVFYPEDLDKLDIPRRRLNCLLYQRSCDLFLGVPFNIASYALLTEMVAQVVNMVPGTFVHTYGDLHLYENHIEQAKEQLSRSSFKAPELLLNPAIKEIDDFKYEDVQLHNYESHGMIRAEMAV